MTDKNPSGTRLPDAVYVPAGVESECNQSGRLQFVNIMALGDRSAGSRIHYFRTQRGWSRMDLARRAKVDLDAIRVAEINPELTPVGIFLKICDALHVSVEDLADEVTVSIDPKA